LTFSGLNGSGVHMLLNTVIGLKKDQPSMQQAQHIVNLIMALLFMKRQQIG
jgi:hypothetical protein